jgi:hypothetical protein
MVNTSSSLRINTQSTITAKVRNVHPYDLLRQRIQILKLLFGRFAAMSGDFSRLRHNASVPISGDEITKKPIYVMCE